MLDRSRHWDSNGLALLFASGDRPTVTQFCEGVARATGFCISHVPDRADDGGSVHWLEMLLDGLTFDLEGLAPGTAIDLPVIEHRFGCEDMPDLHALEALRLLPGPHLSGGERSMPVVRSMLRLATLVAGTCPGVVGLAWTPARAAIGRDYFTRIVTAWLEGGPFPALGLTAFAPTIDAGLQSVGLAFFTGQELRIEPELAQDKTEATMLAMRLVNQIVPLGRLDGPEIVTAPDGRILRLAPSANGRYVRVRTA